MADKKTEEIKPRPYQLALADYVTKRNGIVFLPTGAGKTFVAILVLKRLAHTLGRSIKDGGKRSVFMCNTVELARQQAKELKRNTCLKIGLYIGDRDVDSWQRKKWNEEIEENQVLVGTAQIFVDIVAQNLIRISDFNLVVIDECHHATGNHPMHSFLSLFLKVPSAEQPRVVGLTGVLIKGNSFNRVLSDITKLEATLRGNIITVQGDEESQNVLAYSTKPKERLVVYKLPTHTFSAQNTVLKLVADCQNLVENWDIGTIQKKMSKNLNSLRQPNKKSYIINSLNDFVYQMMDFGIYTASIAIMSPLINFEVKKRQSETVPLRNLYRVCIQYCERIRHILMNEMLEFMDVSDDGQKDQSIIQNLEVMWNFSTPKIHSLLSQLKSQFGGKTAKDVTCLIFVERRHTAKCLYYLIKHYVEMQPELKDVIKPQFMVGRQSIISSIDCELETKWSKSAMEEFRSGECNLIVCSQVLEEGIDVQACNYVFAFDYLKTFNSYVQTKGRARSNESVYCIFAPENKHVEIVSSIRKYQQTHELIKSFLSTRFLDRDDPNDDIISQQFVALIPPFVTPSGAKLLAQSALPLIHRYCASLPWDSFGFCSPWFEKLPPNEKGLVAVSVTLPLQSTVKEVIISDYMSSIRDAKVSAAFKACVRLYENEELNEILQPLSKKECISKVQDVLFPHWKKHGDEVTQRRLGRQFPRLYDRKCPEQLFNSLPRVGDCCYAYAFNFTTQFPQLNEYNQHIVSGLETETTYAILLNKKLPKLAQMPLFMNQGSLSVRISEHPTECLITNNQQLQQLENFHTMIFRDLLKLWKPFLVVDSRNMDNSYLIVPLDRKRCIDWELVCKFQSLEEPRIPSKPERLCFNFRPEDYLNRVVAKWYLTSENERFIVTRIRKDLTPLSPFPSDQFSTYADFYASRHKVEIANKSQFLIEVKTLTHRRNFFNNASNKSGDIHKQQDAVILIPELCHNVKYPGDMWLKALFLPTILHRLHFMLHAEVVRTRVNHFLGLSRYFGNYEPQPLTIDASLKRALDDDGNPMTDKNSNKKLLPPLPPKERKFYKDELQPEDILWKAFLLPIDTQRNMESMYPVDLQYYIRFINDATQQEDAEADFNNSQLNVARAEYIQNDLCQATHKLAISHGSDGNNESIKILQLCRVPDDNLKSAEQSDFLAALTTAAVNDVFDMERLEVLGDAFLKFSVSLYLVNKYPKWNEGFLSVIKGRMVSNRNLLYCLMDSDISNRICSSMFHPKNSWVPPLCSLPSNLLDLLLANVSAVPNLKPSAFYSLELSSKEIASGECASEKLEQFRRACEMSRQSIPPEELDSEMNIYLYKNVVRDKVLADVIEAILGVCVKNYGIQRSFRMLDFFKICPAEKDFPLTNLLDLKLSSSFLRTSISQGHVASFLPNMHILENNLRYTFKDKAYLLQALTHPSYPTNRVTGCYQELEFIGDAILDMLVTCYIFEQFQHLDPGQITDLRSALVNNVTLACICVRHRFHLFMLYENAALTDSIRTFSDFQVSQNHRVTDQVRILLEEDSVVSSQIFNPESSAPIDIEEESHFMCDLDGAGTSWNAKRKSFNISTKIDVPKALGDIFEAIIGAIYLDCRDLNKTWDVIFQLLKPELDEFSRNVPIDAVRQLHEVKHAKPVFSNASIDNGVVLVQCQFNCLNKSYTTNGFGSNALNAKKAAAKQALQILSRHSN